MNRVIAISAVIWLVLSAGTLGADGGEAKKTENDADLQAEIVALRKELADWRAAQAKETKAAPEGDMKLLSAELTSIRQELAKKSAELDAVKEQLNSTAPVEKQTEATTEKEAARTKADPENDMELLRAELAAIRQDLAEKSAELKALQEQLKPLEPEEKKTGATTEKEAAGDKEDSSATVVYVYNSPPAQQIEFQPPRPSPRHVWVPGYWVWRNGRYVWVSGYWVLPPSSFSIWIGPKYTPDPHHDHRYRFEPGHWSRHNR